MPIELKIIILGCLIIGCLEYLKDRKRKKKIEIINKKNLKTFAPYYLLKTMRAGILVLGALLTKYGTAKVSLPGGCAIGSRPIDIHLNALKKM